MPTGPLTLPKCISSDDLPYFGALSVAVAEFAPTYLGTIVFVLPKYSLRWANVAWIRGDSYGLRAKRKKSGLIRPAAADGGPPVGSASLRPVSGGAEHFFRTQRGQFRMAFDTCRSVCLAVPVHPHHGPALRAAAPRDDIRDSAQISLLRPDLRVGGERFLQVAAAPQR